jgi:SAM-dependent methyltransferase
MPLQIPDATENVGCPLCGGTSGIVVGERGRFGMDVRNLCCETCATVYVTPRPTAAAMAEYYRSTYRQHYGNVGYVGEGGQRAAPGDPGYERALLAWHSQQADVALGLADPPRGARVLEIGCRHGQTLALMRERRGIVPFGIEPGEAEAEQARQAGVDCFTGSLEAFEPGDQRFDFVQSFHVLEHVHEPLAALLQMRRLLRPSGRLLIEVPNVHRPYGLLEENFFQNVHLVSYGPSTLAALVRRAGFEVTRVIDSSTLLVVASPSEPVPDAALPLGYSQALLSSPEQDARWHAARLSTYANLEKLRLLFLHRGPSQQLTETLVRSLIQPAFETHLTDSCAFFVQAFIDQGKVHDALLVTLAVAEGPHSADLKAKFRDFAVRLGAPPALLTGTA